MKKRIILIFLALITSGITFNKVEVNNSKDVIDIVSIDKVKSSDKKYIFIHFLHLGSYGFP